MLLPILLVGAAVVVDVGRGFNIKQELQAVADAATLAAARELSMSSSRRDDVPAIIKAFVARQTEGSSEYDNIGAAQVDVTVAGDPIEVSVTLTLKPQLLFGQLIESWTDIKATSVARIDGKPNICVLALDDNDQGTIELNIKSHLIGNQCAVLSNSSSSTGITVRSSSSIVAQMVCSRGGVSKAGTISPDPLLDCPSFDDPLASRPEPTVGACTYVNKFVNKPEKLKPGVYCGGLTIYGNADVTLEPGDYLIKDGNFTVTGSASLTGNDASFYLGKTSWLMFGPATSIKLEARRTGPLAGLLVFASRSQAETVSHTILSKKAQNLTGTVYFPRNTLIVDGDAEVGSTSAYTAIVSRRVQLLNGPKLVLNTDYDKTDVPVPEGLAGLGQPARLVK